MAVDKSKLIDGEGLDAFGKIVKTYVDEHGGSITVQELLNLVEGSQYINVDLNEAQTKAVVSLDQTNLDTTPTANSSKLITSGGVYTALQGKLNATRQDVSTVGGLVKPLTAPTATELVGISTGMEQERVKIGDGLSYDTTTKTLTATGGGGGGTGGTKLYRHEFNISKDLAEYNFIIISTNQTPYSSVSDILADYDTFGMKVSLGRVAEYQNCIYSGDGITMYFTYFSYTLTPSTQITWIDVSSDNITDTVTPL